MSVDSTHPLYDEKRADWKQMRDTFAGERKVKEAGPLYLPFTSGMIRDGVVERTSKGYQTYDAYRIRAVVPDAVKEAVEALLGVMHHKPPIFELPPRMEYLRERSTRHSESLEALLRRINEEQLKLGRFGLLVDVIESGDRAGELYLATYDAETIVNWDEGRRGDIEPQSLNLVVLDETQLVRDADFRWETKRRYRVLVLGDPTLNEPQGQGTYSVGVFDEDVDGGLLFSMDRLTEPRVRGQAAGAIPFTFVNTKDIVPDPDDPPLLGLSRLVLAIYRGEADYRQALHMQGQDTLVIKGSRRSAEEGDLRVGANSAIELTSDGDAYYIGVNGSGLPEMGKSLERDYARAEARGSRMVDTVGRSAESGEALRIRVAARTATLNQIAVTGAFALQDALRKAAVWLGEDPESVAVIPNLDFTDDNLGGEELGKLMAAKAMDAPISLRTIHGLMQTRGLTEMSFEEELAEIETEEPIETGSTNPDGPVSGDGQDEPPDGQQDDDQEDEPVTDGAGEA